MIVRLAFILSILALVIAFWPVAIAFVLFILVLIVCIGLIDLWNWAWEIK